MAGITHYQEKKILDYIFSAAAYTPPGSWYLALYSAAPNDNGAGTELSTESAGYARIAITNDVTNWPATVLGTTLKYMGVEKTFTATAAWPSPVTHWGLFDASTAGNLCFWAALTTPRTLANGDTLRARTGADGLILSID